MRKKRVRQSIIFLLLAVVGNLCLAVAKLYVGLRTNSVCIMLDSTNSFFDIISSLITIVAFSFLLKEHTKQNMYGFGRSEYIAGFLVSVLVVLMGAFFLYESINRIAMPTPIWFRWSHFGIMMVAFVIKLALAIMFLIANRKNSFKSFFSINFG